MIRGIRDDFEHEDKRTLSKKRVVLIQSRVPTPLRIGDEVGEGEVDQSKLHLVRKSGVSTLQERGESRQKTGASAARLSLAPAEPCSLFASDAHPCPYLLF